MWGVTLFRIAVAEARVQFRRRHVWAVLPIVLFLIWFLVSPHNDPGTIYSADKLASRSMRICLLFTSLAMGFFVSDRLLRDQDLNVGECLWTKPVPALLLSGGKCLGNTLFCWSVFVLPVAVMVQLEQLYYAGREYHDLFPFIKAFGFYPFLVTLFVVSVSLCLSVLIRDAMKFFTVFAVLWCGFLFLMVPVPGSPWGILDITGGALVLTLFAGKNSTPTTGMILAFFGNLAFLILGSAIAWVVAGRQVSGERALNPDRKPRTPLSWIRLPGQRSRGFFQYDGRILEWGPFFFALAVVVVAAAILLKGVGSERVRILKVFVEAVIPMIFALTATHCFAAEKSGNVVELLLSKPASRTRILMGRFALRVLPAVGVSFVSGVTAGLVSPGIDWQESALAGASTTIFMCTLAMTAGTWTNDSRFGAMTVLVWFLVWMNPDIQGAMNCQARVLLINPFVFSYHPECPLLESKAVLLAISAGMLVLGTRLVDRTERYL